MGTYRLARQLASASLLTESWAALAEDGRRVTLLRRREPWAQVSAFLERHTTWARGWQALRQADGVVALVETGLIEGVPVVVQEYVEGEPLRVALSGNAPPGKTPLSVVESVAVVLQAARGLLSLSRLSPALMHGDVSASTIVLGADGEVRLEAVGVAAAHPPDAALGPARSELLTLAPEELDGRASPTTDVFRLGLVWLELLTGKTAFTGATHAEVKTRFENFPGVTPGHFTGLPQPIPQMLAAMLGKAPASRPDPSDLEMMLSQGYGMLGGIDEPARLVADAFARLFPGRPNVGATLQAGAPVTVAPLQGAPAAGPPDGGVKLGRLAPRRVTADEVAAARAAEAADAAKGAARDWSRRHARDEGNPKDFALGETLLGQQKLDLEKLDAALQHAQSLGATLFDSLLALDALDEDELLPLAAGLLRQQYLTGPQMLELPMGKAQAALLPRTIAEEWMVLPLRSEGGGLTVAAIDPTRMDVLDEVKLRGKVRSVTAVRATERTITEGLLRLYDGKTNPPEWAVKRAPLAAEFGQLDPNELPPAPDFGGAQVPWSQEGAAAFAPAGTDLSGLPAHDTLMSPPRRSEELARFELDPAMGQELGPPPPGPPVPPWSAPSNLGPLPTFTPPPPPFTGPPPFNTAPSGVAPPFGAPAPMMAPPEPFPAPVAAPPPPPPPPPPQPAAPAVPPVVHVASPPSAANVRSAELPGSLDVASRLFDALLSTLGERGLEASRMIFLVRAVAKQGGATGAPLDQVRLSVTAVVIAALLEGKHPFEVPSRPAAAACLGPHWRDFEDFVRPLLDGDEKLPADPRGVVLSLCFEVASTLGKVPVTLGDASLVLDGLRDRYPLAALAALEIVLASSN